MDHGVGVSVGHDELERANRARLRGAFADALQDVDLPARFTLMPLPERGQPEALAESLGDERLRAAAIHRVIASLDDEVASHSGVDRGRRGRDFVAPSP